MAYRILAIDGGGLRGIIPATVMDRLNQEIPGWFADVDLYAGTSTGGVLALALAAGMRPEELSPLYADNAAQIFTSRGWWDTICPIDEVVRANYDNGGFRKVLEKAFGDMTLGDLKSRVLITTFDMVNPDKHGKPTFWKPKILHNYDRPGNDRHVTVVDAALRTTAAPTYFPSYQGFIDGGVLANNPTVCAMAAARKSGILLDSMIVLSLGTGFNKIAFGTEDGQLDWGYKQWAMQLIPLVLDSQAGIPDYQARQFLGDSYHRFDVVLDEVVALDSASSVPALLLAAEGADLSETKSWLETTWKEIVT